MRPLETEFKMQGFDYKLVKRQGNVAMYEQSKHGKVQAFEVVIIRQAKAVTLPDGTHCPEREIYPKSEDWGVLGWTCMSMQVAKPRFFKALVRNTEAIEAPEAI